jgi:hypothetical protein
VKARKVVLRELNATVPAMPQYLDWSDTAITWDRRDHPKNPVCLSRYALIVDHIINSYGFSKVLIDGGSSINILYVETLQRMKLSTTQLKHNNVVFDRVMPGRQGQSLGSITLDVVFGTLETTILSPTLSRSCLSRVHTMPSLIDQSSPPLWQGHAISTAS